jgi:hypothetical protein
MLFVVALILCSWNSRAPETNTTDLIFSVILVAAPLRNSSDIIVPFLKRQNKLQMFLERR